LETGAVRFGEFKLKSGATSPYYIDIKRASSDPRALQLIGEAIAPRARQYDGVGGMELGAVPIAVATALASGKPYLIVRKSTKEHGTQSRIEGTLAPRARILVVEDVTTTGGSSLEAVRVLREAGFLVDRCVTVVDRESGAAERFAAEQVVLEPLLRVSELLKGEAVTGAVPVREEWS
jgi:orotate phosphoribosyltransferase